MGVCVCGGVWVCGCVGVGVGVCTAAEMLTFLHNKEAVALAVKELTAAAVARKAGGLSLDWEGACVPGGITHPPSDLHVEEHILSCRIIIM